VRSPAAAGYETITYAESDGVATVTLNRPDKYNAFNIAMLREMRDLWRTLRRHDDVRCIVLTGAGDKAFCTGIDRSEQMGDDGPTGADAGGEPFIGFGSTPFHFDDPGEWLGPKSNDLWKPVIAAVNGMACGGAFYMLGEVEFIIAAEHATFFDPHVTYGMCATFEPLQMMDRMPFGEVMRMSLMGNYERISAQRAMSMGLVTEVVSGEELAAAAHHCAVAIASAPALAVEGTVRSIWAGREMGRVQALSMGASLVALGTSDASLAEGQATFASGKRIDWRLR
jgi:enoyl-CoA hydratase/carnithine racemase